MQNKNWFDEVPFAITVCDTEGIILEMNDKSAITFKDDGGKDLIGTSLMDCHPEEARKQIMDMINFDKVNVYTIGKNGKKKLIYQAPWYQSGKVAGLVELSIEIPNELPHFERD